MYQEFLDNNTFPLNVWLANLNLFFLFIFKPLDYEWLNVRN